MKKRMIVPAFLLLLVMGAFTVTAIAADLWQDEGELFSISGVAPSSVTFNANGGTVTPDSKTYVYSAGNLSYGELPVPVREGYVFEGWYTERDAGTQVTSATTISQLSHTLYAHWKSTEIIASGYCGAENDSKSLTWLLDNKGTLIVSGKGAMQSFAGYYDENRPWYTNGANKNSILSVKIDDEVTFIGNQAFKGCKNLTSLTIGSKTARIGNWAFGDCSGLTSVTIPDSVHEIGNGAFYNCSGLTNITLGSGIIYYTRGTIGNFQYDGSGIEDYAFYGCKSLTDIYYRGTKKAWRWINNEKAIPSSATVHYLAEPLPNSEKLGMTQERSQWTVTAGGDITVTVQLLDGSDFDASRVLWSNTGVGIAEITDKGQKDANSAYAVLRGRFPGKTTLTATLTAPLGSSDMRSVSTSQEITVVASGNIWFPTSASRYVVASGQTIDIYAYIDNLPTGDVNKVTWETGDSGNAVVAKKESSGPIFSSPVLVSARLTGYVAGETSVTVTAPDGRSASIPVLVTNSKAAQNVIVTPTASGSLNAEDAPPETPTVSWSVGYGTKTAVCWKSRVPAQFTITPHTTKRRGLLIGTKSRR